LGLNVLIVEVKDGKTLLHIDIEFKSETETLDNDATKTSFTFVFSERSGSTVDVDELDEETVPTDVAFVVFSLKFVILELSKLTTRRVSCEFPLFNRFIKPDPGSNETILFKSFSIFAWLFTTIWDGRMYTYLAPSSS